ncbi:MAG: tRNA pseudouridine(55) synthase TruB [Treponema sp.]|nr:tRNA pseudouridine(55) synthase TruB [Treponema sp.]
MVKILKSGIIFFNKKPGVTSFDALRDIKRFLGTKKVGHTGTLDKFASGLLIVLAGKALKLSQWFTNCDKKYIGKIRFGIETDTLDPEGVVIAEADLPSREKTEQVLAQFTGEILQAPPAYSAIHINGKRASDLARSGIQPEMKKRPVTIYELKLLSFESPFAEIFVHCSSGTYIRSLARDIALAAGSRAHLTALKRTNVGNFNNIEENVPAGEYKLNPINESIISALGMKCINVEPQMALHVFNGKPLSQILDEKGKGIYGLFSDGALIAVVKNDDSGWKYECVLNNT